MALLVADLEPAGDSNPRKFLTIEAATFFVADTAAEGTELWKTDGTAAGTVLVKDINPGIDQSVPVSLMDVAGTLFFLATRSGASLPR